MQPFVPASVFGNDCCRAAAQVALYRILERHHPGIPNEDDSCCHCRLICSCCRDLRLLGRLSLRCCVRLRLGCLLRYCSLLCCLRRCDLLLRRIRCCFIADVANLAANLYKIPAGVGLPPAPNGISCRHGCKPCRVIVRQRPDNGIFCHIHQSRRAELLHHKARHLNLHGCPCLCRLQRRLRHAYPKRCRQNYSQNFCRFFISFFHAPSHFRPACRTGGFYVFCIVYPSYQISTKSKSDFVAIA